MTELFNLPSLRVEQPRKVIATRNQYDYFDPQGTKVASALETSERTKLTAVRAALPGSVLAGARTLLLRDAAEKPLLIIEKHASNRYTRIRRPNLDAQGDAMFEGEVVGTIQAARTTRHYTLTDAEEKTIGKATGDLGLKKFAVTDADDRHVAQVDKKWAGLRAELFTHADRYTIDFVANRIDERLRPLILTLPVVLDLTLHESKDIL
ncbi:phospholipid scramblase-related protein [Thermomonospora curvata]|uniref:phospholipid scramblase-related protein n=1 Tax=Thermomonospora curvata TaxID=2020 RepID=UPI00019EC8BB|nr:phospholipid scramblase-related protein [Thermomonospora curvata]